MTEAQKEYFRGFRDGARAANRDEFKQVIEQLMAGVTDVFKSVPDKLIENINITVDTSALEDWVKCDDALPESREDVLVWFEYFRYGEYNCLYQTYGIGNYNSNYDSWMINHETGWQKLRVIAWKPMPEAPETE